jgi:hypothetical protein
MRPWILALAFCCAELLGTAGWAAAAVVHCADAKTTTLCSARSAHPKIGPSTPFKILLGTKSMDVPGATLFRIGPYALAQYDLEITTLPSQRVTELTPTTVGFSFKMQASPLASAATIFICSAFPDAQLPCFAINAPKNNQMYTGTVQATAPWAALQAPLHIVAICYCGATGGAGEFPAPLYIADATKSIESAATYTLSFDGFTLMDTRSHQTDTVWLNLQGQISSTPTDITASPNACKYVGEKWCLTGSYLETAHNSNYHPVSGKQVSSFRLTPEKENDLRVLFYLYNLGHSGKYQLADAIANGFSDAGEVFLSLYSGDSATAQQLNNYIQQLNGALTASCDGPLALDVAIFNNQSVDGSNIDALDNLTRGSGAFTYTPPIVYHYKDGNSICDSRGSSYTVTLTAQRTSWRNWPELP